MFTQTQKRSEFESSAIGIHDSGGGQLPAKGDGGYRRPVIAAMMSACLPGFGQLYNGQFNRAIWFFIGFCIAVAPATAMVALAVPVVATAPVIALLLLFAFVLWVWSVCDAWRWAKLLQTPPRAWHLSGFYAATFLVCVGFLLPRLLQAVCADYIHPVRIASQSMSPTLLDGDHLIVDKRVNCNGCAHILARGDVVLFTFPNDRTRLHVKRLIGVPGDRITIDRNGLSVNGIALRKAANEMGQAPEGIDGREWTISTWVPGAEPLDLTVPNGHVFVLGDNRSASLDSRKYGPLPLSDIKGKARQIYFSGGGGAIRWARFGTVIE